MGLLSWAVPAAGMNFSCGLFWALMVGLDFSMGLSSGETESFAEGRNHSLGSATHVVVERAKTRQDFF